MSDALRAQLRQRNALIAGGAGRVGWKLGMGDTERTGPDPAVGFLTSATQLRPGDTFRPDAPLHADVEIGVEFAADFDPGGDVDRAIAGYRPVLELVDLASNTNPPETIVATNIFHRAFATGALQRRRPSDVEGRLLLDGSVAASATAGDLTERLAAAARVLATVGEGFRAGDVVITGSIVQVPLDDAREVTADLDALGTVTLRLVR